MRALLILAAATLLLATGVVAECPTPALNDAFAPAPECPAYAECGATLCSCAGAQGTDADTCLATAEVGCNATAVCLGEYVHCLYELGNTKTPEVGCNATVSALHEAALSAVTGGFEGSDFQLSCQRRVCLVLNSTACEESESDPCIAPVHATTVAPRLSIKVTFRLSGGDWALILDNPTARMNLEEALKTDLAALLGVDPEDIIILSLEVGSLIVQFGVAEGSGVSVEALLAKVATATASTAWLTSTKTAYATVSSETLTVLELTVDEVDGETPTTTEEPSEEQPDGSDSSSGSAAAFAVASTAVAAIAVLAL